MLFIKNILSIFISFFLLSASLPTSPPLSHHNDDCPDHGDQHLELSITSDREPGYLIFKLTNMGEEVIETSPIASNDNRIILIGKRGKRIEHFSMKDLIPTKVEPGETKVWRFKITPMLEFYKLQNDRKAQLIWSVNEVESDPFMLNARN
mgnify:CR=1 FL=1